MKPYRIEPLKLYRVALLLCVAAVISLSVCLSQARWERDAARSVAIGQAQAAHYQASRTAAAEEALRQEKDRELMIESGVLTPGWLARRLAIERGLIVPMQDARSERVIAFDRAGHRIAFDSRIYQNKE